MHVVYPTKKSLKHSISGGALQPDEGLPGWTDSGNDASSEISMGEERSKGNVSKKGVKA